MPAEGDPPETRTMRYLNAIVLATLALLVPVATSAAASLRAVELVTTGAAARVQFGATSADGSRVLALTDEPLTSDDTDNAKDLYEFAGGNVTLVSDRAQTGDDSGEDVRYEGSTPDGSHVYFSTFEQIT